MDSDIVPKKKSRHEVVLRKDTEVWLVGQPMENLPDNRLPTTKMVYLHSCGSESRKVRR